MAALPRDIGDTPDCAAGCLYVTIGLVELAFDFKAGGNRKPSKNEADRHVRREPDQCCRRLLAAAECLLTIRRSLWSQSS